MNYADAARIRTVLTHCWFSYTEEIKQADIVIFHTCSIKQKAEDKITGRLKDINKKQKIRITWCMIQHVLRSNKMKNKWKVGNFIGSLTTKHPKVVGVTTKEIEEHKNKGEYIGINNIFNPLFYRLSKTYKNLELLWRIDDTWFLPLILKKLWYKITSKEAIYNEYEKIIPEKINTSMNMHKKTAYIPISTWCNQFCSYCIVPYARWFEKYFPVEQIVKEAKAHLKQWAKEIVLLGQIVNKHPQFVKILKAVLALPKIQWLRYTSPYPNYYNKELLTLHETEEKLCPHIHIPFQSGSDKVLQAMHRWYTLAQAKWFIDEIRKSKRNISITTDIIVGFPNETEKDFKETLALIRYGKFDMIYIGLYSARPWTKAAKELADNIPAKVKWERWSKVNELLKKISLANNKKEVGKKRVVLINEEIKGKYLWYTDNMKQISIESKRTLEKGEMITARITKWIAFKLYGKEEK